MNQLIATSMLADTISVPLDVEDLQRDHTALGVPDLVGAMEHLPEDAAEAAAEGGSQPRANPA